MKIVFFANTDWYLFNFRLPYARYLRSLGHEVVMVSPPGDYGARLEAEGFKWIALPLARRSLNPVREALLIARLAAVYRAERPDLVHHFTIKCVVYGTLAARVAKVPSIVNAIAGFGYVFVSERLSARVLRPMVRRLMKMAGDGPGTAVVVQNADDLAVFRGMGLSPRANLKLIRGSGVDLTRFKPSEQPRLPGPLRVLFVGRLLHDKGIAEFVDCARRCHGAMPGVLRFTAAGEPDSGNPASVDPGLLAQWREEGAVHFAGHVNDMPELLARADIVVLPSYGEGAPRSLIEAAACAKPLVATDVRGCREVVVDGVNGMLVPVRNSKRLAEAVMNLADDAPLRARMGEAGRRHVLATLDEQIVFKETYRTYEELVAASSPQLASRTPSQIAIESAEGPVSVTLAFPERRRSVLDGMAAAADRRRAKDATDAAVQSSERVSEDKDSDRRAA